MIGWRLRALINGRFDRIEAILSRSLRSMSVADDIRADVADIRANTNLIPAIVQGYTTLESKVADLQAQLEAAQGSDNSEAALADAATAAGELKDAIAEQKQALAQAAVDNTPAATPPVDTGSAPA